MKKNMLHSLKKEEELSLVHRLFISLIIFACLIGLSFGIYGIHNGIVSSETTVNPTTS